MFSVHLLVPSMILTHRKRNCFISHPFEKKLSASCAARLEQTGLGGGARGGKGPRAPANNPLTYKRPAAVAAPIIIPADRPGAAAPQPIGFKVSCRLFTIVVRTFPPLLLALVAENKIRQEQGQLREEHHNDQRQHLQAQKRDNGRVDMLDGYPRRRHRLHEKEV